MEIKADQLGSHLQSQWLPIYVVTGQEPLLVQEALDLLRQAARDRGYNERRVFPVDPQFDWSELHVANQSLSLFSDNQILELQLERKPDKTGQQALQDYAQSPNSDNVLIVSAEVLDWQAQKTKWFKTFAREAGVITAWPIKRHQLPKWLSQRAGQLGLSLTPDALSLLAERVDGNLLAAKQELEKLALLYEAEVTAEDILESVVDNARFSVFDLADSIHGGDLGRSQRILDSLRAEGIEPLIVQWALLRETRTLLALQERLADGEPFAKAASALRIFQQRQGLVQQSLQRMSAGRLNASMQLLQRTDSAVKSSGQLDPWLLMGQVLLRWCQ